MKIGMIMIYLLCGCGLYVVCIFTSGNNCRFQNGIIVSLKTQYIPFPHLFYVMLVCVKIFHKKILQERKKRIER
jgi:hypothetical protein